MKSKKESERHRCLYDCVNSWLLRCTTCNSKHTVIRWPSLGHDILKEFREMGILTGAALADAEKLFGQRDGEEWLCEF